MHKKKIATAVRRGLVVAVVVIGGGNGSAVCLEGLKKHAGKFDISAIISMSDSGGSSGKLRKEFNTLPPGDICGRFCRWQNMITRY